MDITVRALLELSRQGAGDREFYHHASFLPAEVQNLNGLSNVCSIEAVGFLPFSVVSLFFC